MWNCGRTNGNSIHWHNRERQENLGGIASLATLFVKVIVDLSVCSMSCGGADRSRCVGRRKIRPLTSKASPPTISDKPSASMGRGSAVRSIQFVRAGHLLPSKCQHQVNHVQ